MIDCINMKNTQKEKKTTTTPTYHFYQNAVKSVATWFKCSREGYPSLLTSSCVPEVDQKFPEMSVDGAVFEFFVHQSLAATVVSFHSSFTSQLNNSTNETDTVQIAEIEGDVSLQTKTDHDMLCCVCFDTFMFESSEIMAKTLRFTWSPPSPIKGLYSNRKRSIPVQSIHPP